MKIVVDTNIVFSGILNSNSRIAQMLIYSESQFQYYSCDYLKTEIAKHRTKLLLLTTLDMNELIELENYITHNITFINHHILPEKLLKSSHNLIQNIDPFDIPFVTLTLHLNAKLWTGDKKLISGLLAKGFKNIITTQELVALNE